MSMLQGKRISFYFCFSSLLCNLLSKNLTKLELTLCQPITQLCNFHVDIFHKNVNLLMPTWTIFNMQRTIIGKKVFCVNCFWINLPVSIKWLPISTINNTVPSLHLIQLNFQGFNEIVVFFCLMKTENL